MNPELHPLVASSQDPTQVANTVRGLVLTFSSIIVLTVLQFFHISLSASDVLSLGTDVGTAAGAIWTIYGLTMKLVVFFGKK